MYEIYWQKTNKVPAPPIFLGGGSTLSPKFWKTTEKQWVCVCVCVCVGGGGEGGRGVLTDICLEGAYCVSCQKRL